MDFVSLARWTDTFGIYLLCLSSSQAGSTFKGKDAAPSPTKDHAIWLSSDDDDDDIAGNLDGIPSTSTAVGMPSGDFRMLGMVENILRNLHLITTMHPTGPTASNQAIAAACHGDCRTRNIPASRLQLFCAGQGPCPCILSGRRHIYSARTRWDGRSSDCRPWTGHHQQASRGEAAEKRAKFCVMRVLFLLPSSVD